MKRISVALICLFMAGSLTGILFKPGPGNAQAMPDATQDATVQPTVAPTMVGTMPADNPQIYREELVVDFGDFQSRAELSYPANEKGPFPTIIMISGTGAWGIDTGSTIIAGQVVSRLSHLRLIADALNLHGFAVMRYNKHYYNGPDDPKGVLRYFSAQAPDLKQLAADAERVYTVTKSQPQVDASKIIIYGWSEGTTIATQLALAHADVAGLVLQAPPSGTWLELFSYQEGIVLDYLHQVVDTNKDGQLTLPEIVAALPKAGRQVSRYLTFIAFDPRSPSKLIINPQTDKNGDGIIDIDAEAKPALDSFIQMQGSDQYGSPYGPSRALPPISAVIGKFTKPVLILQGGHDANVSVQDAQKVDDALAKAGNTQHTLKIYPDYGHELGESSSAAEDQFNLIESTPLQDITDWFVTEFASPVH